MKLSVITPGGTIEEVDCNTEDSVEILKYQLLSLTHIPVDMQKIIGCGIEFSSDSDPLSSLPLLKENSKLQVVPLDEDKQSLMGRINGNAAQVKLYEDPETQAEARKVIPVETRTMQPPQRDQTPRQLRSATKSTKSSSIGSSTTFSNG